MKLSECAGWSRMQWNMAAVSGLCLSQSATTAASRDVSLLSASRTMKTSTCGRDISVLKLIPVLVFIQFSFTQEPKFTFCIVLKKIISILYGFSLILVWQMHDCAASLYSCDKAATSQNCHFSLHQVKQRWRMFPGTNVTTFYCFI